MTSTQYKFDFNPTIDITSTQYKLDFNPTKDMTSTQYKPDLNATYRYDFNSINDDNTYNTSFNLTMYQTIQH